MSLSRGGMQRCEEVCESALYLTLKYVSNSIQYEHADLVSQSFLAQNILIQMHCQALPTPEEKQ